MPRAPSRSKPLNGSLFCLILLLLPLNSMSNFATPRAWHGDFPGSLAVSLDPNRTPPFPSSIVNSYGRMYRAFEFQMFKDIPHNSMAAKHHIPPTNTQVNYVHNIATGR
ncbi:hypothetical protein V2G26_015109 [Clonostachys chloroleuca]